MNRSETAARTSTRFQRTQSQPTPESSSLVPKFLDVRQWSRKTQISLLAVGVTTLTVSSLAYGICIQRFRPVSVLSYKVSSTEAQQVCKFLTSKGLDHNLDPSGEVVLVSPKDLAQARLLLSQAHLPRSRPQSPTNPALQNARESQRAALMQSEERIREMVLGMEGITDASVLLAVPEKTFMKDQSETTASISVTLDRGRSLDESQVQSLRNMVAHSVPDLSVKNVSIVDSAQGRELFPIGSDNDTSTELKRAHWLKIQTDEDLRRKAETVLSVLGPDRFQVSVSTEFRLDKEEVHQHLHPNSDDVVGNVTKDEKLNRSSEDKDYINRSTTIKKDLPTTDSKSVRTAPILSRISASVMVDNLSPAQTAEIKKSVAAAIGIQPERDDVIEIVSLPFQRPDIAFRPTPLPPAAVEQNLKFPAELTALVGVAGLAVGFVGAFLFWGSTNRGLNKPQLQNSDHVKGTTLMDLVEHKSGQSNSSNSKSGETGLNQQLQEVADLNTNRLAETLKGTWLQR